MSTEPLIVWMLVGGCDFAGVQGHRHRNSAWIESMAEEHNAIAAMEMKANAGVHRSYGLSPLLSKRLKVGLQRGSKFQHSSRDSARLVECVRRTSRERALN